MTNEARDELQAVDRNPAKLWKTAAILLAMMLVGGVMVMAAYLVKRKADLAQDRPSIRGRLTSNLAMVNDRKETVDIGRLEGKVWLATQVCLSRPDAMGRAIAAMKWVDGEFAEHEDLRFVCFAIDPNRDGPEELAKFREHLGVGERWWFVAAGEEPIRRYLKNQMKLGEVRVDADGTVDFDSMVLLVDRHRHFRPAYDFNLAWAVEDAARRLLDEEPERADEFHRDFGVRPEAGLGQIEKLRGDLRRDVQQVLAEDLLEETGKPSS